MTAIQIGHDLNIAGLSKFYDRFKALDDVSLVVKRGEFLTLLGPSGSGKTTLLMCVAGFVQPDAGDLTLDQRSILHLPPEQRNFGMVFQGYALFPHMSVFDNVAFPLRVRKRPRTEISDKVKAALDLVQLGARADHRPRQLSGGQQQRVALARAMVFSPHLLLLDEPLSALDKNLRAEMQDELRRLHQRLGLTFIYVTHDQDEALSMSDRIAVMRDGKIMQQGSPSDLYERPATTFIAGFLGKSNFIRGTVEAHTPTGFKLSRHNLRIHQTIDAARRPSLGQNVVIALRPEKIMVLAHGATTENAVDGVIAEWSYLGSQFRLAVEVAECGLIAVTIPTSTFGAPPTRGEKVTLSWDAAAGTLVAES
jgi:putative spermidine/putrescine transport system ATP-binding protein